MASWVWHAGQRRGGFKRCEAGEAGKSAPHPNAGIAFRHDERQVSRSVEMPEHHVRAGNRV
jgi:hypothetical protein